MIMLDLPLLRLLSALALILSAQANASVNLPSVLRWGLQKGYTAIVTGGTNHVLVANINVVQNLL